MSGTYRQVRDMRLDEVSLVDTPANPHARVLITKAAAAREADMPGTNELDFEDVTADDLAVGDIVQGDDGKLYEVDADFLAQLGVEVPNDVSEIQELETVGKSADLIAGIRDALSKGAATPEVAAAVEMLAKRAIDAETAAEAATQVAKSVSDAYLLEQYTQRAAEYGIPGVDPANLAVVMKSAAEALPEDQCAFLNDLFTHTGELSKSARAFEEIGKSAGADPFGLVPAALAEAAGSLHETIGKSADGRAISKGEAMIAAIEANPELYTTYLADQHSRSFGING